MKSNILTIFGSKLIYPILVVIIMIMGFGARTYKIHNPIADWHSWRQADTAAVSRNFIKDGFNFPCRLNSQMDLRAVECDIYGDCYQP